MRTRFSRSSGGRRPAQRAARPERQWLPLDGTPFSAVTATSASRIFGLEEPTVTLGTALTSDPAEDVVVDRIMGQHQVTLSSGAIWQLALLVTDTVWTPTSFLADADKRFLWTYTYSSTAGIDGETGRSWQPPGQMAVTSGTAGESTFVQCDRTAVMIDVTPKVKVSPGQALVLVAYETTGAATFSMTMFTWRLLIHRAKRR